MRHDHGRTGCFPVPLQVFALVLVLAGCNGPLGVMSGGQLDGDAVGPPAGWQGVEDYGNAQLETNPTEPYSVNLVYTVMDDVLYVNAGDNEAQWVKHMNADPQVRLRIDDNIYELRAERVTDTDEIAAFAEAWTSQSMFRRDPTGYEVVYIYRLLPR